LFCKLEGKSKVYVWCHVDDTFVCATDQAELLRFQEHVRKSFEITVMDDVNEYLGLKLETQRNGDVLMTQPKLLQQLIEEFDLELALHFKKMTTSPQRKAAMQSELDTPITQKKYLHLLGALLYLCKTRPDIATAVSFAACHSASPTEGHYMELLHCLNYLKGTKESGLLLKAGEPGRPLLLTCYVDASYLTHADSKSHTGYCMSFGTIGTFYAKSGKQTVVATSSTHAEMRALYTLTADIVFTVHLMEELDRALTLPCVVMQDNQPVIDLLEETSARTKRCKHFLMMINWIREQVTAGLLTIRKVATTENLADVLTKIITGGEFSQKAELLTGGPP
jgi:hypothetical protein